MIFGAGTEFAVEATLGQALDKWRLGQLRLWLYGAAVGDFDDTCDLVSSARWGRVFLAASSRRERPDLDSVSFDEVFFLLYGRHVDSGVACFDPWDRDPYVLDDFGDAAVRDKWSLVVVRRADKTDRIIVKNWHAGSLEEHVVGQGICDEVISSFCSWVESMQP